MPWSLRRYQNTGYIHFITFSCYQRRPLLQTACARRTFDVALERVRHSHQVCVHGYVVMPEHVHLVLSETGRGTLADPLKSLKQSVARRLVGSEGHFWQKRYYDFNVFTAAKFTEKLRYLHRNPVRRGLCEQPEDWDAGSFLHYATGCAGHIEIESEWTAWRRGQSNRDLPPVFIPGIMRFSPCFVRPAGSA